MKKTAQIITLFTILILVFAGVAGADIPAAERQALIDLYNSTDGANWTNTTGWLGDAGTECSWYGVTCNTEGTSVTKLILSSNNLTGTIPASVGDLTNLQQLSLNSNALNGSVPSELGNLSALTRLELQNNQLSGDIPSELGNISTLYLVAMEGNLLSGSIPASLGNLSNLRYLALNANKLTGSIPASLGNLSNATHLTLNDNQLTGNIPSELGNLSNLTHLYLSTNQLSGTVPSSLGSLSKLASLKLNRNQLTGSIPSELGNLANLTELYLYDNQLTGSIPEQLGNLTNLQQLWLNQNQLSGSIPAQLGSLAKLQILYLNNNQLTGSIPSELGNLTSLQHLYLLTNQLSGSIPTELGNLSALQHLFLSSNQLTGSIPPELGNLSNLTLLDLYSNQLSGTIPIELTNLANLQRLHLYHNQLSGTIPPGLANLSNLQILVLADNQFTGTIPPGLGSLSNLTYLSLGANQLTGNIPAELGSLSKAEHLLLYENQLTGAVPAELGNLTNLTELRLDSNQLSGSIPSTLANLTNLTNTSTDFRYNAFYTNDDDLRTFLNAKQSGGDWESTQTTAPSNLAAGTPAETAIPLTWTAITYTGGTGGYEVYYSETSGGPYTLFETTADKTAETSTVTGLSPDTPYYFRVRTKTDPTANNTNTVYSEYTDEISATTDASTATGIPAAERQALIDLYNSTDGANWTNTTGWLGDAGTECSWYGVTCNTEGTSVTKLILSSNNLTGTIPASVGDLTNLQQLSLNSNVLSGSVPSELGNLSALTRLELQNNQLSGEIPSGLGDLSNLSVLALEGNALSGAIPASLGNLSNLTYLTLNANTLTGSIPASLGNLSNLTQLYLQYNSLSGTIPAELGNLTGLTNLSLGNNQLAGAIPTELTNLIGLSSLNISYNAMYATDEALRTFLDGKQSGWQTYQTIAPADLAAGTPTETAIPLTWTAITYTGDTGGYEVYYAETSGGPYTLFETTADKTAETLTVTGLSPDTPYYFKVRTKTDPTANNTSTVYSEYTDEISATTDASTATGIPAAERQALIDLYNSTDGANWTDSTNWLGDAGTECTWYGITCNTEQTHVTQIDLNTNALTGTIPASIGDFSELRTIALHSRNEINKNQLTGNIPPELGNLNKLTYIDLQRNQLSGSIPPELSSLSNLTYIDLSSNQLTGSIPPELGSFNELTHLRLEDNQLTGSIPPELGNLSNLTYLRLHSNQLTGSIPPELGNLSKLTQLLLAINRLTGNIPPELGNLSNLTHLSLRFNQLTGSIPRELGDLSNLIAFQLDNNQLSGSIPIELVNLNNLEDLRLNNNHLSGTIPPELGNLTNLNILWLGDNQLSGTIPAELGSLTNLTSLGLSLNELTGEIPPELGSLTNLAEMIISANQLSGSIPPELGSLTKLTVLQINDNQLTGEIPPELGSLTKLTRLFLHKNQLTGNVPAELGSLTGLTQLYLNANQLSGSIPTEFTNLTNLAELHLEYNAFHTDNDTLRTFLNSKQDGGNWESSQTVAPINLAVGTPGETSIPLTWTAIAYTGATGGYEVYFATTSGGPYTLFETTADKTATGITVTGLSPDTTYYFRVRTKTDPHTSNTNTVYSEYTDEISAATEPLDGGDPDSDLIAYYPLTGNANDESGNGNNASASGGYFTTDRFGELNQAYYFDGTDARIDLSSLDDDLKGLTSLTVSAWVKNRDAASESTFMVHHATDRGFWMGLETNGDVQFGLNTVTPGRGSAWTLVDVPSGVSQADWTFMVLVWDGAELKGYVNGTLVCTREAGGTFSTNTGAATLYLGYNSYNEKYFKGDLDDIRFYGRALSEEDVLTVYDERPQMTGYWMFDEGAGDIAADSSGNGNTGTIFGATWTSGHSGSALDFKGDGTGEKNRVAIPGTMEDYAYSGEFTVMMWINATDVKNKSVLFHSSDEQPGISLNDQNQVRFNFKGNVDSEPLSGEPTTAVISDPLPAGEWVHVAASWNGSEYIGYVCGKRVGHKELPSFPLGGRIFIGQDDGGGERSFDGLIDEVRIYNYAVPEWEVWQMGGACHSEPDGLIAHWKFDETGGDTVIDSTGNGHDGTVVNYSGNPWQRTDGVSGGALDLTDGNNYVAIPDDGDLSFSSPMTVATWVKIHDVTDDGFIVYKTAVTNANRDNYRISYKSLYTAHSFGTENALNDGDVGTRTTTEVSADVWYHVAGVYNGSQLRIYLNGALENTVNTGTCIPYTGPADLIFGTGFFSTHSGKSATWANAAIDDVRLYNYALSDTEIEGLYNDRQEPALVAHWKFDETDGSIAVDSSGNGHDGTITNFSGNTWQRTSGVSGGGLDLTDGQNYVRIPDDGDLSMTGQLTVAAWMKLNNANAQIIDKYASTSGNLLNYTLGAREKGFKFQMENSTDGEDHYIYSATQQEMGIWYHITGVYDGAKIYLYVNGVLETTKDTGSFVPYTGSADLILGTNHFVNGDEGSEYEAWTDGVMDEIRIYNYALSDTEIEGLYNDRQEPALVAHWKFDETDGSIAVDSSGNGHDGTITGAAHVSGFDGNALDFSSSDANKVEMPGNMTDYVSDQFSVSMWVNITNTDDVDYIFHGYDDRPGMYVDSENRVRFKYKPDATQEPLADESAEFKSDVLPTGEWVHILCTWDGSTSTSGTYKGYVNGELAGQKALPFFTLGEAVRIGNDLNYLGKDRAFDGLIDDVRIYNYVLSEAEIQELYDENAPPDISRGLVARYEFENNANDSSGNGNDGTEYGGLTYGTGVSGQAANFDGVDDYIINTAPSGIYDLDSVFSISFWINPQNQWGGIINVAEETKESWSVTYHTSGVVGYHHNWERAEGMEHSYLTEKPPLNAWTHIVLVYNEKHIDAYVNGVYLSESDFINNPVYDGDEWLEIGANRPAGDEHFLGKLDDFRIYNRPLSEAEIQELYNDYAPDTTPALVAHYEFEGNANDSSGNGNDGTENGGLTYSSGVIGQAASFDGVDDYIEILNDPSLELNRYLTISYFMSPQPDPAGNFQPVVCKNRHTGNNYSSWIRPDSAGVSFQQFPEGSNWDGIEFPYTFRSETPLEAGKWIHVAMLRDDTVVKIYLDGVLVAEGTANYEANETGESLFIGYDGGFGYPNFKGLLDDVRIYNYALSEAEIQEISDQTPRLIAHWKFDETSGDTVIDSTGNGHDGTITNFSGNTWQRTSGVSGGGLDLTDGKNYVAIPDDGDLSIPGPMSVGAWVKLRDATSNIVFKVTDTNYNRMNYVLGSKTTDIFFWTEDRVNDTDHAAISTSAPALGEWCHIMGVYDDEQIHIYVNGVLNNSATIGSFIPYTGPADLILGTNYFMGFTSHNNNWSDAVIDDVRIYNYALSAEDIQELYNANAPDTSRGLVAHYPFNGNANDISGNGNDGTEYGGLTYGTGVSGQAANFDGVDDYIINTAPPALQKLGDAFSISFWIKPDDNIDEWVGVVNIGEESKGTWEVAYRNESVLYFHNWNRTEGIEGGIPVKPQAPMNEWSLITYIYADKHIDVYRNGEYVSGADYINDPVIDGDEWLQIGLDGEGGDEYFAGQIDDLRIYNYALSETELQELYDENAPPDISRGLVAHYEFENNANDSSGNGNDGTEYGGLTYGTGIAGQAASFDGVDDYIEIYSSGELVAQDSIAVSAWIKPDKILEGIKQFNIFTQNDTTSGYVTHDVKMRDGKFAYDNWLPGLNNLYSATDMQAGTWQHVVASRENGIVSIWINGELDATGTGEARESAKYVDNTLIGARYYSGSPHHVFDGLIDDLRIYNRSLSEAEIQELYNLGSDTPTDELVAYYPFNGNANDESGNGYHGDVQNGVALTADRFGNTDSAYHFDGVDDWINVPGVNFDFTETEFTFSVWFKADELKYVQKILWVQDDQPSIGLRDKLITFGNKPGTDSPPATAEESIDDDLALINESEWNFAAYTYTSDDNTLKFYLNGSQVGWRRLESNFIKTSGGRFRIGVDDGTNDGRWFSGSIDELKVYARALSAGDIQELYEESAPVGTIIYVDASFTGTETGTETEPYNTISEAIANAVSNSTLRIAKGTYTEALSISSLSGLTLEGGWNNAGGVWTRDNPADPGLTEIVPADTSPALTLSSAPGTAIDGLLLQNGIIAQNADSLQLTDSIFIGETAIRIEDSTGVVITGIQTAAFSATGNSGCGLMLVNSVLQTADSNIIHTDAVGVHYSGTGGGLLIGNAIHVRSTAGAGYGIKIDAPLSASSRIENNVLYFEGSGMTGITETAAGIAPAALVANQFYGETGLVFYHDGTAGDITDIANLNNGTLSDIPEQNGNVYHQTDPYTPCTQGEDCFDLTYIPLPPGMDSDGDNLPDEWEIYYFGDITSQDDTGDPDSDGLDNLTEYENGTNPAAADTDEDGTNDADEIADPSRNPLIAEDIAGQELFVDAANTGTESGAAEEPYNTIAEAIAAATPGSTIKIAKGIYAEALNISSLSGLTLEGGWNNAGGVWTRDNPADPGLTEIIPADTSPALTLSSAPGTAIDGLLLQNGLLAQNADSLQLTDSIFIGETAIRIEDSTGVVITGIQTAAFSAAGNSGCGLMLVNSVLQSADSNIIHTDAVGVHYSGTGGGLLIGNAIHVRSTAGAGYGIKIDAPLSASSRIENNVLYFEGSGMTGITETAAGIAPAALVANQFYGETGLVFYHDGTAGDITDIANLNNGTLSDIPEQNGNVYHQTDPYTPCTQGGDCFDLTYIPLPPGMDSDGDNLPDEWEIYYFGDITSQDDTGDPDSDGLDNLTEYENGTNPAAADTDEDGTNDADEIADPSRNPLIAEDIAGQELFVDAANTGTESGAAEEPYNTIAEAIAAATPGSTIKIAKGIYAEALDISSLSGLTLEGGWNNAGGVWTRDNPADPGLTEIVPADTSPALTLSSAPGTAIDGLLLQNGLLAQNADSLQLTDSIFIGETAIRIEDSTGVVITGIQTAAFSPAGNSGCGLMLVNSVLQTADSNIIHTDAVGVHYSGTGGGILIGNAIHVRSTAGAGYGIKIDAPLSASSRIENNVLYFEGSGMTGITETAAGISPAALVTNQFYGETGLVFYHDGTAGDITDIANLNNGTLSDIPEQNGNVYHQTDPYTPCTQGGDCFDLTYIPLPPGMDSDGDNLPDEWEIYYFGNITSQDDTGDPDSDGLDNLTEYENGTNPAAADTDEDGANDADEIADPSRNPLIAEDIAGQELFVDAANTGTESGAAEEPYNTIAEAIAAATPGSTIKIAKGTYEEAVAIADLAALTIEGGWNNSGGVWTRDNPAEPGLTEILPNDDSPAIDMENAPDAIIDGVLLQNGLRANRCDYLQLTHIIAIGSSAISIEDSDHLTITGTEIAAFSQGGNSGCGMMLNNSTVESLDSNIIHADFIGIYYTGNSGGSVTSNAIHVRNIANAGYGIKIDAPLSGTTRIENNVLYFEGSGMTGISESTAGISPDALLKNQFYGETGLVFYHDGTAGDITDVANLNNGTLSDIPEQSGNVWHKIAPYVPCTQGTDCFDITYIPLPPDRDGDGDGLPDEWEIYYFGDITSQNNTGNPDNDGLDNLTEYENGTNPTEADTDGDGTRDDLELLDPNRNPLVSDRPEGIRIYVDSEKSAAKESGTTDNLYATIGEAVRNAEPGSTICVAKGTYTETVFVENIEGLTITGGWNSDTWEQDESPDPNLTVIIPFAEDPAFYLYSAPNTVIQGFSMRNGVYARYAENLQFTENKLTGPMPVQIEYSSNVILSRNDIKAIAEESGTGCGVSLGNASGITDGNVIRADSVGVHYQPKSSGAVINNTIYLDRADTADCGIKIESALGGDLRIANNVLYIAVSDAIGIREIGEDAVPAALSDNQFYGDDTVILYQEEPGKTVTSPEHLNDGTLSDISDRGGNTYVPIDSCEDGDDSCGTIPIPKVLDSDGDGLYDSWEIHYFGDIAAYDGTGNPDQDSMENWLEHHNGTDPTKADLPFTSGVFTVGQSGLIGVNWLYDGGSYKGELGIFSLTGMERFVSNTALFIGEAARRSLSNSHEGHVVLSDWSEGAQFDGELGGETSEWNGGPYKGMRRFEMSPGDSFAIILVPNSTLEALSRNPGTTNSKERPLFSLAASNADYGMHMGQVSDINGYGNAFVYEDQNFANSDKDYNDFIFQIGGITEGLPVLEPLSDRKLPVLPPENMESDDLGVKILDHLDLQNIYEDDRWISLTLTGSDVDLILYDPQERECGKEGCDIPGAIFGFDEAGNQILSLPALEFGDYRVVIQGTEKSDCYLQVAGHQGYGILSEKGEEFKIKAHETLKTVVSASAFFDSGSVDFETPYVPRSAKNKPLKYDFNGNENIGDDDINQIASKWNMAEGDEDYDPFYDLNDDGMIDLRDIHLVNNSKTGR